MSGELTIQQLLDQLHSTDQEERLAAILALSTRRSLRAVKPLVQAHMRRAGEEQRAIIDCLRQMGEIVLPPLNTIFLKDVNPALRAHAAYLLGELCHPQSVAVLTRGVAMPHELVRAMAVAALNKFDNEDGVFVAFLAAIHDPAQSVRIEAALALGRRGDVRAVPILLNIIEAQLVLPRNLPLAMAALAATGDPRAIEALYDVYLREQPHLRYAAVMSLGDMPLQDPRILTVLRDALHDPAQKVRDAARECLQARLG